MKVNGKYYEFGKDGARVDNVGWKDVNGKTYYFLNDHSAVTGKHTIDSKVYDFGSDGALVTSSKQNGLVYNNGKTQYFVNGVMQKGWQNLPYSTSNPGWHYFDTTSGAMVTGWNRLPWAGVTSWYYFSRDGKMLTGWQWINGNYYYLKDSGAMAEGWQKVNGVWYYLTPGNGAMVTGWKKINYRGADKWFHFDHTGAMSTGIIYDGGYYYYLYNDGTMAGSYSGKTVVIDGLHIDSAGKILNPQKLFGAGSGQGATSGSDAR